MPERHIVVGIDVSKATLAYIWLPDGRPEQTENSFAGIANLLETLGKMSPTPAVLEATGGYRNHLADGIPPRRPIRAR